MEKSEEELQITAFPSEGHVHMENLIRYLKHGDLSVFREFFGHCQKRLYLFTFSITQSESATEDPNKEINANTCFNKRNGNTDGDEYYDKEPYDERFAIERTNAWIDSFGSLLNRFDTTVESWKGFNYLTFYVIDLKKFIKKKKYKPHHTANQSLIVKYNSSGLNYKLSILKKE